MAKGLIKHAKFPKQQRQVKAKHRVARAFDENKKLKKQVEATIPKRATIKTPKLPRRRK